MKVYCLNCGKLLAEPDKNHSKGRVKCPLCKCKYKFRITADGMTVTAKGRNLPFNRTVDILETCSD